MRVVLTDQVFPTVDVEREIFSRSGGNLEILPDSSPETIRAEAADADAILTTYAAIDAETVAALKSCKVIARYGIGVDNIDLEAARSAGITVTNVPDYCVEEVADHTIALLLAVWRKIVTGNQVVRNDGWGIAQLRPVRRLRGTQLGMIGFGHIGRAVAARATTFGLELRVFDPYIDDAALAGTGVQRIEELGELLSNSDIVTIHAPLTSGTKGLIDAEAIDKLKDGAVLINTSRGPIVDTKSVAVALETRKLSGAGLDVFDEEPPDTALLSSLETLVATPHAAFYSDEAIAESQTKAATSIVTVLSGGEPDYRVV
jgi:D-3-phosphoglycerate dehydrogenase / 2-oxoglutarate reductase